MRDRLAARRPETSTGRHRARRCPQPQPNPCQTGAEPATTRSGRNGPAAPTRTTTAPRSRRRAWRRRASASRHRGGTSSRTASTPSSAAATAVAHCGPGGTSTRRSCERTTPSSPAAASPRPRSPMAATQDPSAVHWASRARASEVAPGPWVRVTVPRRRPGSGSNPSKAGRTGSTCSRASTRGCDRRPTAPSPFDWGRPGSERSLSLPSPAPWPERSEQVFGPQASLPDVRVRAGDRRGPQARTWTREPGGAPTASAGSAEGVDGAIPGGPGRASSRATTARPWGAHPSAPMDRACASSTTAWPPARIGTPLSAPRRAAIVSSPARIDSGVLIDTPTIRNRWLAAAVRAKDRAGTSAPRSDTSQPRPRTTSARRASGSAWCSPAGAPSTTVPRLRPRRWNRGPRRPRRRPVITLARCSTATSSTPSAHRRPMVRSAGATMSR